jgi:hypothetical protein
LIQVLYDVTPWSAEGIGHSTILGVAPAIISWKNDTRSKRV